MRAKTIIVLLGLCFVFAVLTACGDVSTGVNYLVTGDTSSPSSGSSSLSFSLFGIGSGDTSEHSALSPASGTSVVGGPSLSAAFVNQVLTNAGSPAQGLGDTFYSMSQRYGIDDIYALAFYQHESSFGTAGEARFSLSIGNLRCVSQGYEDLGPWCAGGYTHFPSWQAGIEAWYRLIKNVYVNQWGCSTVESIIPHYAPNADNNNEAAYIASVEQSVDTWRQAA
jgi:Mannosyl-glycoprotein endo-beta-N-acetylglucosaminidase.